MYTSMLAALEGMVVDDDEAVYHRIFAWWILTQTWCTLRFSDHRGISPQEVRVDEMGLGAILRRSKTIGTDTSIVSRPLVLDRSCFVKEQLWLATGWKVLREAADFERDFLLPAPTLKLRGCRRAELKYEQGYALQNRVLREIKVDGTKMFRHPVTTIWTPHSGRAYLPTAAQILEFSKEERDFLGGWLAQASDRYARSARRKIVNMQRAVAREIRTKCPGRLAEEETSLTSHDFLKAKGLPEAERNDYVETSGRLGQFFLRRTPSGTAVGTTRRWRWKRQCNPGVGSWCKSREREWPDKRRKWQNTRTEILGDDPRERRAWLRSPCAPGFYVCVSQASGEHACYIS